MAYTGQAVSQGAAALEVSLGSPPDLIVSEVDLPLVCGLKLAEILRANPRTRAVRFLFLGAETSSPSSVEVGDVVVSAVFEYAPHAHLKPVDL